MVAAAVRRGGWWAAAARRARPPAWDSPPCRVRRTRHRCHRTTAGPQPVPYARYYKHNYIPCNELGLKKYIVFFHFVCHYTYKRTGSLTTVPPSRACTLAMSCSFLRCMSTITELRKLTWPSIISLSSVTLYKVMFSFQFQPIK